MKQTIVKIINNYKPAFLILLLAVVGMQAHSLTAQTAPAQKTELKSAAAAKRALADINSRSFGKIKDDSMRRGIQQSYKALKAVANNKSEAKEPELIEEYDRSIRSLKSLPQPTGGGVQECDSGYERCMEVCKATPGADCKQCGWGQNLCYLVKLAIEMTKKPTD